jgi:hypothetical protein
MSWRISEVVAGLRQAIEKPIERLIQHVRAKIRAFMFWSYQ